VVLPDAADAAAWLIETARDALARGDRVDLDAVLALRALAPAHPVVAQAVDRLDTQHESAPGDGLAAQTRRVAAALRLAVDARDENLARRVVSDLETELLGIYRPGHSLGSFDSDVTMASLLLDVWELGAQLPHQMMAEELMLIALRVHWDHRHDAPFTVRSEAARTLARLHKSTGKREYHDHAVTLLADDSGTYRDHGLEAAQYVLALQVIS